MFLIWFRQWTSERISTIFLEGWKAVLLSLRKKKHKTNTTLDSFPPVGNNLPIYRKVGWCSLRIFSFLSDEDCSINLENEIDCRFCQPQVNLRFLPLGWVILQLHIYMCRRYSLGSLRDINIEIGIFFIIGVCVVTGSLALEIKMLVHKWLHSTPRLGTSRLQSYKLRRQKMPGQVDDSLCSHN